MRKVHKTMRDTDRDPSGKRVQYRESAAPYFYVTIAVMLIAFMLGV